MSCNISITRHSPGRKFPKSHIHLFQNSSRKICVPQLLSPPNIHCSHLKSARRQPESRHPLCASTTPSCVIPTSTPLLPSTPSFPSWSSCAFSPTTPNVSRLFSTTSAYRSSPPHCAQYVQLANISLNSTGQHVFSRGKRNQKVNYRHFTGIRHPTDRCQLQLLSVPFLTTPIILTFPVLRYRHSQLSIPRP